MGNTITHSTPGIDFFDWNFSGAEIVYGSFTAGPYGIRWNTPGPKVVTVIANDDLCKSLPVKDTIQVHGLPEAKITLLEPSVGEKICTGDSLYLQAATFQQEGTSYQWLPQQFFGESNSFRQWGTVDFARYVMVKVTDKYNCGSSDSLFIDAQPCCQVFFHNAFTPNNDGHNDRFGVISRGHHQISVFRIQNRWGQTVFETADERVKWDGTFNGQPQDMGTYFYYIKYKCADGKFYEDKGEMMLVR